MKRTNLVLDEKLLEMATRLSGEKAYSRAVQRALEKFVRRIQARQILELAGSGFLGGLRGRDASGFARPARETRPMILIDTSVWIEVREPIERRTAPCLRSR